IEGSLTSRSILQRLSYSVSPVTSSLPIPYSWQVSQIRTGPLIDQPERRFQLRSAYMKITTGSKIYLPMAAMILAALAVSAAAQNQVPFKGMFQGNDTDCPPPVSCTPTAFVVKTDGTGIGTHLS